MQKFKQIILSILDREGLVFIYGMSTGEYNIIR